jgi:DMSO/TMAO reductase YedYZ heme-binding membrane subunit
MVDGVLKLLFVLHDWLCDILVRYGKPIRWFLLGVAHASLLGLLFPTLNRSFANLALMALLFLLFLSPVSRLLRMRLLLLLMGYRREVGILMGYWAIVHGLNYLIHPDWLAALMATTGSGLGSMNAKVATGVIASVLTLPLLVTSNLFSQKLLKLNWKRLHRLAYPLLFMALFHKFVFAWGSLDQSFGALLLSCSAFGVYILVRFLASDPSILPFVSQSIQWVAGKYQRQKQSIA